MLVTQPFQDAFGRVMLLLGAQPIISQNGVNDTL